MLFNTTTFAIFLPIVLVLYWSLRTPKRQNILLLIASLVFYGWWDERFVLLLLASTVTDYFCALGIERSKAKGGGQLSKAQLDAKIQWDKTLNNWATFNSKLDDKILQGAGAKVPEQYRQLVRQYFQALAKQGLINNGENGKTE